MQGKTNEKKDSHKMVQDTHRRVDFTSFTRAINNNFALSRFFSSLCNVDFALAYANATKLEVAKVWPPASH
jgi:hypothetical protein